MPHMASRMRTHSILSSATNGGSTRWVYTAREQFGSLASASPTRIDATVFAQIVLLLGWSAKVLLRKKEDVSPTLV